MVLAGARQPGPSRPTDGKADLLLLQCTNGAPGRYKCALSASCAVKKTKSHKSQSQIRVRREPPTLDEAIAAAQGLSDDLEQQVAIAAGLIGMTEDEVRPHA